MSYIAIVDYGAGNLMSVQNTLDFLGCDSRIADTAAAIEDAAGVILPGVGAFPDAMDALHASGLTPAVRKAAEGKPFLGICLGLQILFEESEESPGVKGLGLLRGRVLRLPKESGLKIPHIGWNSLSVGKPGGLFAGVEGEPYVYFVHSYYLRAEEDVVTATAEYGTTIHAAVQKGNLLACQFHPEKSGQVGLSLLENFKAMAERGV